MMAQACLVTAIRSSQIRMCDFSIEDINTGQACKSAGCFQQSSIFPIMPAAYLLVAGAHHSNSIRCCIE